jgi:D-alanyl-D-alanine carboxypeptidase/D-alanyl-D-alanine-endopeptidase (penicillin-binding protein 4)
MRSSARRNRRRKIAFLVLTLALASACGARTSKPASPEPPLPADHRPARPPADPYRQLQDDLERLFTDPRAAHAHWAVNVFSLHTGRTLFSSNASRFMVPASNQKLLTTAVAAERLGWDFRFTTRILATGPIDGEGVLTGDLIVVSNGDPTINPRHPERWQAFDDWARALRAGGLTTINGNLIGDDNAFAEPGWGLGWAWDNLQYGYGAPVSALQFNENQIELTIGPGAAPGTRATISTSPIGNGMSIDHGVDTGPAGTRTSIELERVPGTGVLHVRGVIAADARPTTVTAATDDPTRMYLSALGEALGRHGISVGGRMMDIDEVRVAPDIAAAREMIVDRSPPLSEIIDVANKWSRNIYAETLLYALAPPGEPATAARGIDVLRQTLRAWGLADASYLPRDGSGLSRYDFVTADALTLLLTYLWRHPAHTDRFRSALPVAGQSGTIAERMKGTDAAGRVWAKTGTLSHVRTLSGYLVTTSGEPLVVSILVNNFQVPAATVDAIIDEALVRLVRFAH